MAESHRLSERLRSPTLAAFVGLACAAGSLYLACLPFRRPPPPPTAAWAYSREEVARLGRALAELRAPLDRVVKPAQAQRWIGDAFTGWSGPAIDVGPGPLLEGFGSQFRLFRVKGTCPVDREEDLVRRLLAIEGAPRWLSGRRAATADSVTWEVMLAFRSGPQPPAPRTVFPWRTAGVQAVERVSPVRSAPRGPVRPRPGMPALAASPAPPAGPVGATLDLTDPWTSRSGEVAEAMGSLGRAPVERVVTEGPPSAPPAVRVERTLVSPGRPWACYAIVDGKLVRPGDSVGGLGVRAILPGRLLLGEEKPIELPAERGK